MSPYIRTIESPADLSFDVRRTPSMPLAHRILMVRPTYFHLENPINPHMRKADGGLHALNKAKSFHEWESLRSVFLKLGVTLHEAQSQPGLPDMVFCANQCLPYVTTAGEHRAILSNMANDIRQREVPAIQETLEQLGYKIDRLPARTTSTLFEGMGDALWLPGHRVLLGGYGHRTSRQIYSLISELTSATAIIFELVNPRFYHLDTCLCILDSKSALACREAFTAEGWQMLQEIFPRLIEVPVQEGDSPVFACNAHCPDGKHVVIQSGARATVERLRMAGFIPVEVSTDEFIKSGGSVFCMKLQFF
jgi:N-dimethylarginine dimethylaminohydrolase